jgi:hypothetical protein
MRAQATATGTEVVGRRLEEFAAFIRLEIVKWGETIEDAGIKLQRYRYLCIMRITLPISEKESSNASEEFGEAKPPISLAYNGNI